MVNDIKVKQIYNALKGMGVEEGIGVLELIKTDIMLNSGAVKIDGKICQRFLKLRH